MLNKITDEQKATVLETAAHIKFIIDKFSLQAVNLSTIENAENKDVVLTTFWMDNVGKLFKNVNGPYTDMIRNMPYSLKGLADDILTGECSDVYLEDIKTLIENAEKYGAEEQRNAFSYILSIIMSRHDDDDTNEHAIEMLFDSKLMDYANYGVTYENTRTKFFDYIMINSKYALKYVDKINNSRYGSTYNTFGSIITNTHLSKEDRIECIGKTYTQKESGKVIEAIRSKFTNFDVIDDFITATILDNNRLKNKKAAIQSFMIKLFVGSKMHYVSSSQMMFLKPGFKDFAKKYVEYIDNDFMNNYDIHHGWGRQYQVNSNISEFVTAMISSALSFDDQMKFCEKYSWFSKGYCARMISDISYTSEFNAYKYDATLEKLLMAIRNSIIDWTWDGNIGRNFHANPGRLMSVYPSVFESMLTTSIDKYINSPEAFGAVNNNYLSEMDDKYASKVIFISKPCFEEALNGTYTLRRELELISYIISWFGRVDVKKYNLDAFFNVFDTSITDKIVDIVVSETNSSSSYSSSYYYHNNTSVSFKDRITGYLNTIKSFADKFPESKAASQASENIDTCVRNIEVLVNI